ncbi:uncharacterized protein LOC143020920 [Oratosquilla oratoria]|uniref:uncharacterized protein LOC143020920 n=1 Tax=Oratosquilla oratoria TaxID=337810 RepID=UPI003F75C441
MDNQYSEDQESSGRESIRFKPEQEKELAEWLKQHEIFYNKKLNIHKDACARNRLVAEKAKELNCPPGQLRSWLDGMRTRYGRLSGQKKEVMNMSERERWIYENFDFLGPHIVRCANRQTKRSLNATVEGKPVIPPRRDGLFTSTTPVVESIFSVDDDLIQSSDQLSDQLSDQSSQPPQPSTTSTGAVRSINASSNTGSSSTSPEDLLNKLQEQYRATVALQTHTASLLEPVDDHEARVVHYTDYLTTLCRQMPPQLFRIFQKHTSTFVFDLLENPTTELETNYRLPSLVPSHSSPETPVPAPEPKPVALLEQVRRLETKVLVLQRQYEMLLLQR